MALDLNAFRAIADGKYNLGQISISEDGESLVKVNNHRWKVGQNNVQLTAAQNRNVRYALVSAMAHDGLSSEVVQHYRAILLDDQHQEESLDRDFVKKILDEVVSNKPLTARTITCTTQRTIKQGLSDPNRKLDLACDEVTQNYVKFALESEIDDEAPVKILKPLVDRGQLTKADMERARNLMHKGLAQNEFSDSTVLTYVLFELMKACDERNGTIYYDRFNESYNLSSDKAQLQSLGTKLAAMDQVE